ncbi:MAG: flagellar hook-length control protein FliK [Thiotrichales bacterium]
MDVANSIAPVATKPGTIGKPTAPHAADPENAPGDPFVALLTGLLAPAQGIATAPPAEGSDAAETANPPFTGNTHGNSTPFTSDLLQATAAGVTGGKLPEGGLGDANQATRAPSAQPAPNPLTPGAPPSPAAPAQPTAQDPADRDWLGTTQGLKLPTATAVSPDTLAAPRSRLSNTTPTVAAADPAKTDQPTGARPLTSTPSPLTATATATAAPTSASEPAKSVPAAPLAHPIPASVGLTPSASPVASAAASDHAGIPATPLPVAPAQNPTEALRPTFGKRSVAAQAQIAHASKLPGLKATTTTRATTTTATTVLTDNAAPTDSATSVSNPRATTSTHAAPLPTLALQRADAPAQLGAQVNWMVQRSLQHATIQLDPVELGPIQIKLSMTGTDQLQIQFLAHHAQTRETLEQHLPRLRETLAENGFGSVDVDVSGQQNPQRQHAAERESPWRTPGAAETAGNDDAQRLGTPAAWRHGGRERIDLFA